MARKILVVDDDPVGLALLKAALAKAGFEVFSAWNGVQGLELLRKEHPDLVILDIEMPQMNGYEFALEMKQDEKIRNTPVIVLTAHEENRPIFKRKGILNYLVKPVKIDELFAQIGQLIGS